jgi:hypothetical protein
MLMEDSGPRRWAPWLAGFCAVVVSIAGGAARAQGDRDTQEISRYALTEAGLAKYSAATQHLNKLGNSDPSRCEDKDDESPSSLDQFVAKIDAKPAAKAAIQSAGMTTREYMVFSMSLFQTGLAAWALEQPGGKLPPGVSKANVDFYKAHKATIDKLGAEMKDKCKDSGDDRNSGGNGEGGDSGESEQ